ncbi:MAG: hypothetical protein JSW07_20790 [bacterium]|nr:MAG: hypothetical protein JSW07_20790 [bacterium]
MKKIENKEPIPQHFNSFEEASDFWDTHDTGDYEEFLRPLNEELEISADLPQAKKILHYHFF